MTNHDYLFWTVFRVHHILEVLRKVSLWNYLSSHILGHTCRQSEVFSFSNLHIEVDTPTRLELKMLHSCKYSKKDQ